MHASVTSPVERRQGRLEDYKQTITERTDYISRLYVYARLGWTTQARCCSSEWDGRVLFDLGQHLSCRSR